MRRFFTLRKILVLLGAFGLLFYLASAYALGSIYLAPKPSTIGDPPAWLGAKPVEIEVDSGKRIHGWWMDKGEGTPALLLLHGIWGNRLTMVQRARLFHEAGYSVLLIDMPSHGESYPDRVSFGYFESKGIDAAYRWIRSQHPQAKIGADAISLGGAALVYSQHVNDYDAILLESTYSTIQKALYNRIHTQVGIFSNLFYPTLLVQIPLRLDIDLDSLSPLARMPTIRAPTFLLSGSRDLSTEPSETREMFQALAGQKELWIMEKAAHEDLCAFDSASYSTHALAFLNKHLKR
ncbi:MAG: hypothetical protein IPK50_16355 [Fibrobacterota bacterium]|nr:hypothetical protein [Fibrobacterota bacterium]QQS03854.1 MAG: hypothetical protein IPK50_16355 [Fibrobacterota bacterium]